MRKFLTILSATALMATPTIAQTRGFDSDFSQKVTGPFKLEIVPSEDLAHRAENLPKKLSDRGASRRLNAAFSNNGKYGEREVEDLLEDLEKDITDNFAKRGVALSDTAPTLLRVTIVEVKPNRPTFNQLGADPSLSFSSLSIGGAEVSAEFVTADGNVLGTAEYDYFSSFNDLQFSSKGIWTDTNRAFSRFAKKLSKKLAAMEDTTS